MDTITENAWGTNISTQPTQGGGVNFFELQDFRTVEILRKVWLPHLLVLGTFGNIATIFVMRRLKDHNSSQHVLLMSLAVSDLLVLYTGALSEWLLFVFQVDVQNINDVSCKLNPWLVYSVNSISAWLVTSVTVQRTMAVIWPHKVRALCTVRKTWAVVAAVVTTSLALNLHFVIGVVFSKEIRRCTFGSSGYRLFFKQIFTWLDMSVSSFIPAVTQLVCDVILSSTLLQATSASSVSAGGSVDMNAMHGNDSRRKRASRTTVMVLALSCMFLLLTMPVCLCLLWYNHVENLAEKEPEFMARKELVQGVTSLLWFTNSAINFLLYCVTGTKFRTEFLSWVCCGAQRCPCITGGEATTGSAVRGKQK